MDIVKQIQDLQEENARLRAENERLTKPRRVDAGKRRGPSKWRRMVYRAWQEIEPLRRPSAIEVIQKILVAKKWGYYDATVDAWGVCPNLNESHARAAHSLIKAMNGGDKYAIQYRSMLAREFEGSAE